LARSGTPFNPGSIPGKQIQLTIDYDLQQIAEQSLGAAPRCGSRTGPRTGEVLAMVSHPALDPNDFAVRISADDWKNLNEDPQLPLLNRAIQAQLRPGLFSRSSQLRPCWRTRTLRRIHRIFAGLCHFLRPQFKCWVYGKSSHGVVGLHKAILESCDILFYNVGMRLALIVFPTTALKLGLGHKPESICPRRSPG